MSEVDACRFCGIVWPVDKLFLGECDHCQRGDGEDDACLDDPDGLHHVGCGCP